MTTPIKIKCFDCVHLEDIEKKEYNGPFIYKCKAFLKRIPSEIVSWENPHVTIRKDQKGSFIFKVIKRNNA